ncbi:MAG: WD40/YVTN/BNR-like repeat-containing protein [Acidimicrobiales bacterium]
MLATTDGGRTWSPQPVPPGKGLYDLHFVDVQRGWAVGLNTVLATTDGGRTWTDMPLPPGDLSLLSTTFSGPDTGWVAGIDLATQEGVILSTPDGGASWSREESEPTALLRSITSVTTRNAWAGGTDILVRAATA